MYADSAVVSASLTMLLKYQKTIGIFIILSITYLRVDVGPPLALCYLMAMDY